MASTKEEMICVFNCSAALPSQGLLAAASGVFLSKLLLSPCSAAGSFACFSQTDANYVQAVCPTTFNRRVSVFSVSVERESDIERQREGGRESETRGWGSMHAYREMEGQRWASQRGKMEGGKTEGNIFSQT